MGCCENLSAAGAIRAVRTVWRLRDRLAKDAGREIQHLQKGLTTMNVRLANAISDVSGVTGMAIVRAILGGARDPYVLAKLRDPRIRASEEENRPKSGGELASGHPVREMREVLELYDFTRSG